MIDAAIEALMMRLSLLSELFDRISIAFVSNTELLLLSLALVSTVSNNPLTDRYLTSKANIFTINNIIGISCWKNPIDPSKFAFIDVDCKLVSDSRAFKLV